MTSRQVLRLLLALVAVPLCFEATTGCDLIFKLDYVQMDDNALRCACSCNSSGTATVGVQASTDDAEQVGAAMNLVHGTLDMGAKVVGVRFANVAIPAGATIQTAKVQFTAAANDNVQTDLTIAAETSVAAATFSAADNDLSGRTVGGSIAWSVPTWATGVAGTDQQTPELKTIIQALVDQPGWSSDSAVVLRIQGTGARTARAFDGNPDRVAVLSVTYDASVVATLPVCADSSVGRDANHNIVQDSLNAQCARVQDTVNGLAAACSYPTPCTCTVVDVPDKPDSFQSKVCGASCPEVLPDATCSNFDPNGFTACLEAASTVAECESFVSATNAAGGSPVCVASGSPLAFHLFGRRSRCDVSGTSQIHVGDREPKHDPATDGTVELLGGPCPGGGCSVSPFLDLRMDPITFAVRFHSDPTFTDLGATGRALGKAALDGSNLATFEANAIDGTGKGRRSSQGYAVNSKNADPLGVNVDWVARTCAVDGNLAADVDSETPDEGKCQGDDTVVCTADSPDCDDAGGPCVFDVHNVENMTVNVALIGDLVNQPPTAVAGADQAVECTSTAGASFKLNGRGSHDPDGNLSLASWRKGSRVGSLAGNGLTTIQSLGVGAASDYILRVIDAYAQADEDTTHVAVQDTTPPTLTLAVSPTTLKSPNHKLVKITASLTTSDTCDAAPIVKLLSITSNEPDNGLGDGDKPGDIDSAAFGTDDRSFELRNERGGVGTGRIYTITYESRDHSGNATVRQATVTVPH